MGRWRRFFLETPKRLIATFVAVGMIIYIIEPKIFSIRALLKAVNPLLVPTLTIFIMVYGLRLILFGGRGKKK